MSIIDAVVQSRADIEALRSAFGRSIKVGSVEMVDPQRGYRLKFGEAEDGKAFLSPWYPHPETGKSSIPLKLGQVVGVVNPSGDPRQGFLVRAGYSDDHPAPNQDMAANVFSDAGVTIRVAAGSLVIEAAGVAVKIDGAGLSITGGRVEHNGKNIGSTHRHGGILVGSEKTLTPE